MTLFSCRRRRRATPIHPLNAIVAVAETGAAAEASDWCRARTKHGNAQPSSSPRWIYCSSVDPWGSVSLPPTSSLLVICSTTATESPTNYYYRPSATPPLLNFLFVPLFVSPNGGRAGRRPPPVSCLWPSHRRDGWIKVQGVEGGRLNQKQLLIGLISIQCKTN